MSGRRVVVEMGDRRPELAGAGRRDRLHSGVQVVTQEYTVDRERTVPFLLRLFPTTHRHRDEAEYGRELPKTELQVHTWMDCTLRELVDLLRHAQPEATRGMISFRRIYPAKPNFRPQSAPLGSVHSHRRGFDDGLTLHQLGFEIGDYLDVVVHQDR